jgi:hypothetical protein
MQAANDREDSVEAEISSFITMILEVQAPKRAEWGH